MKPFKILLITPTTGTRPEFLARCWERVDEMASHLDKNILWSHDTVYSLTQAKEPDITEKLQRYFADNRDKVREYDLIFFIEDDDWYHQHYLYWACELHRMFEGLRGCRILLGGLDQTFYYHIIHRQWKHHKHNNRSSLFTTWMRPELIDHIQWNKIWGPFVDLHLWSLKVQNLNIVHDSPIAIGIKHGFGKVAGKGHESAYYTTSKNKGAADDLFIEAVGARDAKFYYDLVKHKTSVV
jgi:hypothetical protein